MLPPPRVAGLEDDDAIDRLIATAPCTAAVFLLWPKEGAPYLGRTASLRRRVTRLLRRVNGPTPLLNLRAVASRLEFWPTGSRLTSLLYAWELGRRHFPDSYQRLLKLRMPAYVKLIRSHIFPRTHVTQRLTGGSARFFGPFRSRASAERFESDVLDLFQIRRCQEDFDPSPEHPGCIYGEMNRCLRPCQQVVGVDEYGGEVRRLEEFLATAGASLLHAAASARDRASEELNFEEAARQHQRLERIQQVLSSRDELTREISRLDGVAVTPAAEPESLELWFLLGGAWSPPHPFELRSREGQPISLDRRLHALVAGAAPPRLGAGERQEHLAILARWYYSSWRDGEWLPFEGLDKVPYRKLVNAIHRVVTGAAADPGPGLSR